MRGDVIVEGGKKVINWGAEQRRDERTFCKGRIFLQASNGVRDLFHGVDRSIVDTWDEMSFEKLVVERILAHLPCGLGEVGFAGRGWRVGQRRWSE